MLLKILYWFLLQSAKIRCYGVQNITRIFQTFNMHLFFHIFHLFFRQLTACQLTKLPHRNAGFVQPDIHIDLSDRKTKWAFEYLSKRFLRRPTELWPGDQAVCKHNQSEWTQSFSPESKLFTLKKNHLVYWNVIVWSILTELPQCILRLRAYTYHTRH